MDPGDTLVGRVLECANRVAGTTLSLPPGGDLPLKAFGFDSLTSFAFILELENLLGLVFDENNLDVEELHSIRSAAAVVLASQTQSDEVRDEPGL